MMMMMILINNSSNNNFDLSSLNCYFFQSFCMVEILFFFLFHHFIFNLLEIEFHGFSKLSASGLMTLVIGLKS